MSLIANPYLEESDGSKDAIGGQYRWDVASGAASASLVTVNAAMLPGDKVHKVINLTDLADETANVTSVAASGIKLSSVTSGKTLLVSWLDRKQGA